MPKTTRFQNNLIYNRDGKDIFTVHDDISGIEFENNVLNEVEEFPDRAWFQQPENRVEATAEWLDGCHR